MNERVQTVLGFVMKDSLVTDVLVGILQLDDEEIDDIIEWLKR